MSTGDNPFWATVAWIGARADANFWVSPVSAVLGTIGAGALLADPGWLTVPLALVVAVLFTVPELCASWWRGEEEKEHGNALTTQHLMYRNALKPIADLTAQMLNEDGAERDATFRQALQQAVGSCVLRYENGLEVRALVFAVSDDGKTMRCVARAGRDQEPKTFDRGTRRGNKAFKALEGRKVVPVSDLRKKPREWAGSGEGYECFVTAPIIDSNGGYGLLSIDAPLAGTFSDSDVKFVELVASMLAVLFADRSRTSKTGSSPSEGA